MPDFLDVLRVKAADVALADAHRTVTCRDLPSRVRALAAWMADRGVVEGERVAVEGGGI